MCKNDMTICSIDSDSGNIYSQISFDDNSFNILSLAVGVKQERWWLTQATDGYVCQCEITGNRTDNPVKPSRLSRLTNLHYVYV